MKILRTLGVIVAVALAVIGLAVLPSMDDAPQARAGISVGETPTADEGLAPVSESATQSAGESVPLPAPTASEQPVRGIHSDTGVGAMEPVASPEPAPAPQPAAQKPRSSGSTSSTGGSSDGSSASGSSSATGSSTPPRPAGVCEWDDGELECDDEDDDDDDDDE